MVLPVFDPTKHDVGINGVGFMRAASGEGTIQRQDFAPATARAALGEGRYDTFQTESFLAQVDWEGGAGQGRLNAKDMFLTGVGDSRYEGRFFPARKKITESDGGSTSHYASVGSALYGFTDTAIETVGTATSQARTAGNLVCKPVVSGNGAVMWVQDNAGTNALFRWTGSGSPANVTPSGIVPDIVSRYGKWMWCFGRRTRLPDISIEQSRFQTTGGNSRDRVALSWTNPTTAGNTLLAAVVGATPTSFPAGWMQIEKYQEMTLYLIEGSDTRAGNEQFILGAATTNDITVILIEIAGVMSRGAIDILLTSQSTATVAATSTTTDTTATGTLSQAKSLVLTFSRMQHSAVDVVSATSEIGYTEVVDTQKAQASRQAVVYVSSKQTSATTSEANTIQATLSGASSGTFMHENITLVLKGTELTAPVEQFTIHYSENDGASWREVAPISSTGIGRPRAALAAQGYLWFTTDAGLYHFAAEEQTYADQIATVLVAIRGPLDQWSVPYDTDAIGTQLTIWDGALFYNVGATIRRFAIGGQGNQLWPTTGWATIAGKIQALTSGEGGIYWGSEGYLWCYDGRGFHQIAAEPAPGDLNTLHWHQGRLYFRDDPASYFDFRYPSTRPDMVFTAPTPFTTGYMVTSETDFEKVNVLKVIRQFEAHANFTAGTTEIESGFIDIDYLIGCNGTNDPGKLGGGATSLTWVNVGRISVVNGGTRALTLATPLECHRLYLRATLVPGTLGYPILTGVVVYGRALMPSVKRFVATLAISTGVRDKTGAYLYPDSPSVKQAVDHLLAQRDGSAFTMAFVDERGGTADYLVTAESLNDWLTQEKRETGIGWLAQFAALEVP